MTPTHTPQLREDLNRSLSDSLYQCEQTASLRDNLQEAEDKLKAAQEENEAMRNEYERTIQDMREKVYKLVYTVVATLHNSLLREYKLVYRVVAMLCNSLLRDE